MSKATRNAKLAQLLVDVQAAVTVERARLTKEAAWLRIVQSRVGLGAIAEGSKALAETAAAADIAAFLDDVA